jgi:hypothetical protein
LRTGRGCRSRAGRGWGGAGRRRDGAPSGRNIEPRANVDDGTGQPVGFHQSLDGDAEPAGYAAQRVPRLRHVG